MRQTLLLILISTATVFSQHHHDASSGDIKSLSAEEISGFSEGLGMGQAKAAELNGFPGPKHLLERTAELKLSGPQVASLEKLRTEMTAEARKYGAEVIESERVLNRLFVEDSANEESLSSAVQRAEEAKAKVRLAHLRTHLAAKKVLTDDQLKLYYAR